MNTSTETKVPSQIKAKIAQLNGIVSQEIFISHKQADDFTRPLIDGAITDLRIPSHGIKANRLIDTIIETSYINIKK